MAPLVQIPVSVGELIDKITILELKCQHIEGEALAHVQQEHQLLQQVLEQSGLSIPSPLLQQLRAVNAQLWEAEDAIRAHDRALDFGAAFVDTARSIHRLNDRRAALKRAISLACGSPLIEEKVYGAPRPTSPPSSSAPPPFPPPAAP
ncbi:DUF6165 family protein [Cyanobium sp. NIES-981]|uniref:DUF6165 family protein n=1 Tax=Cyanobium sp. NIES-981 TaxID=1851505 RepID=UPI0007DDDFA0|nr:DUF6165 family protein [Cyanobium sp. NIES-981]SBO41725.1 conserved protein of unknown function [Cyanobium sp. NIES-981]